MVRFLASRLKAVAAGSSGKWKLSSFTTCSTALWSISVGRSNHSPLAKQASSSTCSYVSSVSRMQSKILYLTHVCAVDRHARLSHAVNNCFNNHTSGTTRIAS